MLDFGGALDGAFVRVTFLVYDVSKIDPGFDRDLMFLGQLSLPATWPAYARNADLDGSTFTTSSDVWNAVEYSAVNTVEFTIPCNTTDVSSIGFHFIDFSDNGSYDVDMLLEYNLGSGFVEIPGDETNVVIHGFRNNTEVDNDMVGSGLMEVIGTPVDPPEECFWTDLLRATQECVA